MHLIHTFFRYLFVVVVAVDVVVFIVTKVAMEDE